MTETTSDKEKQQAHRGQRPGTLRRGALAAAVGGGALLLVAVLPLRGQEREARVRIDGVGRSARVGRTRVNAAFELPTGARLARNPRVRVTNPRGGLEELLPLLYLGHRDTGECYRDLHSHTYRPGVHQVQTEMEYFDGQGARRTVVSSVTTLTIR